MAEGDTFVNAILGAAVTAVLSGFVPLAPLLGGAVAGYLHGGGRNDGVRIGALSGVLAMVPAILIGAVGVFIFGGVYVGLAPVLEMTAIGIAVLFVAVAFALVYFVGLGAAGGWLGNYVKYDTDIGA